MVLKTKCIPLFVIKWRFLTVLEFSIILLFLKNYICLFSPLLDTPNTRSLDLSIFHFNPCFADYSGMSVKRFKDCYRVGSNDYNICRCLRKIEAIRIPTDSVCEMET